MRSLEPTPMVLHRRHARACLAAVSLGLLGLLGCNLRLGLVGSAPKALSPTSYSANFDGEGAPGWTAVQGSWAVSGGTYNTTGCDPASGLALAVYPGAAWDTNYTCRAAIRSQGAARENTPGLVFNYTDADHYYYLLFDMAGDVELGRMAAGTRTTVAKVSSAYHGGGASDWEDVEIIRAGKTATVHINGARVFNQVELSSVALPAGNIGLCNFRNEGSFDHVSVTRIPSTGYADDFNDGSTAGWSAIAGTWSASTPAATYQAAAGSAEGEAISVYDGATWDADYTYSASVRLHPGITEERAGLIFDYVDAGDYCDVLLNPGGAVELDEKTSGTLATVASAPTFKGCEQGGWVDLTVLRKGDSTTSVTVNGRTVFSNVRLPGRGAGQVGLKAVGGSRAEFDDVLVINGPAPYKRTFPKLGQMLIGGPRRYDLYEKTIAQYDVVILGMYTGFTAGGLAPAQIVAGIKGYNAATLLGDYTCVMEAYSSSAPGARDYEVYAKLSAEHGPPGGTPEPNDWWARTSAAKQVSEYPRTSETNLTYFVTPDSDGYRYPQWYANREYAKVYRSVPYDIWYSDNAFYRPRSDADWDRDGTNDSKKSPAVQAYYRQGMAAYFQRLTQLEPTLLLMGNVDGHGASIGHLNEPEYQGYLPAAYSEAALGQFYSEEPQQGGWRYMMGSYWSLMDNSAWPHLVLFDAFGNSRGQSLRFPNTYSGGAPYAYLRYALCSSMLEDGYFVYSTGPAYDVTKLQWFDEFDVALGHASEGHQRSAWSNGVYKRLFQNGLVLVNPRGNGPQTVDVSSVGRFKHFSGAQDPVTNNGQNVTSVTLGDGDGLVLINR
jgi:hypothetical protein